MKIIVFNDADNDYMDITNICIFNQGPLIGIDLRLTVH